MSCRHDARQGRTVVCALQSRALSVKYTPSHEWVKVRASEDISCTCLPVPPRACHHQASLRVEHD